jgi:hypothetical protein
VGIKIKGWLYTLSLLTQDEIEQADKEFWRWVFREEDSVNHPLKKSGNNITAQTQLGSLLIVAGSFPDNKQKKRLLKIPPDIKNVFVTAENCVYTFADNDGSNPKELIDKANNDMLDSQGKVFVKGKEQTPERLSGHAFSLDIQHCIALAGKSGKGEGKDCIQGKPPGDTTAAAACDYLIIRADTLNTGDTIETKGVGRAAPNTTEKGTIDVIYTVEKVS